MVETQKGGRYNTVGPEMSWAELLYGIKGVTSTPSTFTWADADFLRANKVRPYFDLPLWWPPRNDYNDGNMPSGLDGGTGAFNIKGDKARAAGLTHRPLADIARDTLWW
jgi:2'-hydroxyisoflavone reductase